MIDEDAPLSEGHTPPAGKGQGIQMTAVLTVADVESLARELFGDYVEELARHHKDDWAPRRTIVITEDGSLVIVSAFHDDDEPVEKWENYYQIHLEVHRSKARALIYIVSDRVRHSVDGGRSWGPWEARVSLFVFHRDYTPWHGVSCSVEQIRDVAGSFLGVGALSDPFVVQPFSGAIAGLFWDCCGTPDPRLERVVTDENLTYDGEDEDEAGPGENLN